MAFEHLFQPIKIGPVEIKNRIVHSPMNVHMSDGKGYVTDQDICYYVARAKGGVGLIVFACVLTSPRAAEQQKMMVIMFPLMFLFICYKLPSGIVLYWLTNTIIMVILQEFVLKVRHMPPKPA